MKLTYTQSEIQEIVNNVNYIKGQCDARAIKDASEAASKILSIIAGDVKK
jgi:hypothetical protein